MRSKRLNPRQNQRRNWSRNPNLLRKHRSGEGRLVEGHTIVEVPLHEGHPGAVDPPLENLWNRNKAKRLHSMLRLPE